jgi:N-acetylneuraminic acid mutarotase
MKRFAVILSLILAWPTFSHAHFIFLLTDATSPNGKLKVYFGDAAEPDDPALLDKIAKAEAWIVGGRGEPKPLALTKGADSLEAELSGAARQSTVILRHNYGVLSKGGAEPFLLKYYAKTHPFALTGTWRIVKDSERLPLEIVPTADGAGTMLAVHWRGQPLAGATVTVVGAGIESKIEGTTNEAGNVRIDLPRSGVFSIRAKHTEAAEGLHDGKEYKSVRHYSTLTLHYDAARLAPVSHGLPALPKGSTSFGGAVVGDMLFVYGGNYGSAHEYSNDDQSGDLWKLNLKQPTKWELVSGGTKLQGLALVQYQGTVYRIGGFTAMNKMGEKEDLRSQADFARLDPSGTKWESLPSLPEPRSSHDAAVIGDTLYVVGGWNMQGGGQGAKWHDTALALNLAADKAEWKTVAAPSFKRRALALADWNGKLLCIGGMNETGGTTTDTAVFDPAKNEWSVGPTLLGSSMDGFGSSAFANNGAVYVTTMSGSIQRLEQSGQKWEYLGQLKHPRFFHRVLPWGDSKLLIVGGASMGDGKAEAVEVLVVGDTQTAAK